MNLRTLMAERPLLSIFTITLVLLCGVAISAEEKPIWDWDKEEILEKVGRVRAGKDLTPPSWPDGNRVAVSLSFDVDTEPVWLAFTGQVTPSYMSRGEYGARVGLPRILRLLDREGIPATFFVPAATYIIHPSVGKLLRARPQHEIGFHSHIHENPLKLSADEERSVYKKAMEVVVREAGKRPVGFRSAAWDLTESTVEIVKEMGFLYESSLMADDRPYQLLSEGKDTGLVELPVEWILDDWPYFQLAWSMNHHGLRQPDDVYEIWKAEFDEAYEEGTTFILTMHPQVIGHRHRIRMLRKLIDYFQTRPGVWFATHEEIALYVKEQSRRAEDSGE